MNKFHVLIVVFCIGLSACGVRYDESESQSFQGTSSPTGGSSGGFTTGGSSSGDSDSDELAADEQFEDGSVVKLRFAGPYTGFWENLTRSDDLSTEIMRISFGVDWYHIERFEDQSSGSGTTGENCYSRPLGQTLRELSSRGLWFTFNSETVDGNPISTDDGWTLVGDRLEYTYFDDGELQSNLSTSYQKVFDGLAIDGLQFCDSAQG